MDNELAHCTEPKNNPDCSSPPNVVIRTQSLVEAICQTPSRHALVSVSGTKKQLHALLDPCLSLKGTDN